MRLVGRTWPSETYDPQLSTVETRIIDGHPAFLSYSLVEGFRSNFVHIYDEETGLEYVVNGRHPTLSGIHVDRVIAIARSLYEPPNSP